MKWVSTLGLGVVLFVVVFWRLGTPTFWDPDEAHYAESTRELLSTGDWLAPYYNEEPFFDKPIFFHHLQAAAMLVAGENELGARLVPALGALALVGVTGWLGMTLVSVDVGLVAALLLATSPGVFALARYAILDSVFTAFLFGGIALLAVAALKERATLQYPGYLLVAAAVLIKGPLAIVLCGITMGLAILMSGDVRRRLLALRWVTGLGLVLAATAPWFAYMYFRFRGEFIAGYALDENIRLYATNRFGSQPGFSFYFRILAAGLLPWTGMVLGRLVDDLRTVVRRAPTDAHPARDSVEILLWAWVIAVVGFFSLSRFKLDHYVFPAAPAICLLLARAWADLRAAPMAPEHRWTRLGQQLVGPLLVVMGAAGAFVLVARLELAAGAILVPVVIAACGVFVTIGARQPGRRLPRVPWLAASALTVAFVGVLVFVMPALEQQKVVPDVARWVASHAEPGRRVASYQLNRWNTAFRFYVDRHTTLLESPEEAGAFLRSQEPFYCVMVERAYEDLVARGLPLTKVYERDGMWATAGRALWRSRLPPTRFVVVTRALLPG